ncbi:MAG: hypothetical protein SP1CHLAM54_03070 [Chlamydiia bacterium]|nr:hypothetical protein [Chlamydiia bacterium]MCH9615223.1 hypothetical protein [Chlamydiia bacterium]MCH9628455.1 hypothetical protein [Chlamydiia bacterium]
MGTFLQTINLIGISADFSFIMTNSIWKNDEQKKAKAYLQAVFNGNVIAEGNVTQDESGSRVFTFLTKGNVKIKATTHAALHALDSLTVTELGSRGEILSTSTLKFLLPLSSGVPAEPMDLDEKGL